MSFLRALDPTGNNFLGLGPTGGRVVSGIVTGGAEELGRPDPFGAGRNTIFAKVTGGAVTGAITGAAVGFATGGPFGAIVGGFIGAVGGGVAGATGATNNYTPVGFAKNVGIGVGSGLAGGGAAALAGASTAAPAWTFPALKAPSLAGLWGAAGISGVLSSAFTRSKSPSLQSLIPGAEQRVPAAAPAGSSTMVIPSAPASAPGSTQAPVIIAAPAAGAAAQDRTLFWVILAALAVLAIYFFRKKKR